MTAATTPAPMMLDWLLPEFDATLVEHRVVDGEPEAVYRAVTTLDMAALASSSPAVRVLFAVRGTAERLLAALLGRPAPEPPSQGPLRLGDMPGQGEWVKIADEPPREFAFGAIGRFWDGETTWKTIDAHEFVAFDEPGFAKLACSISLRRYGTARTLASYEVRTLALDPESRVRFLRYWRVVRPGVAIVMRAFLHAGAKEVR